MGQGFLHLYKHFLEVLANGSEKVALDVGCGSGADLLRLAEEGLEVVGVDIVDTLEVARDNTRHLPTVSVI